MFIFLKNLVTDVKDSKKNHLSSSQSQVAAVSIHVVLEFSAGPGPFRISLLDPWWELSQPSSCPCLGVWPSPCPPASPADLSPRAAARARRVVVLN